jgi:hypothetical protein
MCVDHANSSLALEEFGRSRPPACPVSRRDDEIAAHERLRVARRGRPELPADSGQAAPVAHHGRHAAHGGLHHDERRGLLPFAGHDEDVDVSEDRLLRVVLDAADVLDSALALHLSRGGPAPADEEPPGGRRCLRSAHEREHALVSSDERADVNPIVGFWEARSESARAGLCAVPDGHCAIGPMIPRRHVHAR